MFYPSGMTTSFHNLTWHLLHIEHLIYLLSWNTRIALWALSKCWVAHPPHRRRSLNKESLEEITCPANETFTKPRLYPLTVEKYSFLMQGKVGLDRQFHFLVSENSTARGPSKTKLQLSNQPVRNCWAIAIDETVCQVIQMKPAIQTHL